jgi:hypothetical protein
MFGEEIIVSISRVVFCTLLFALGASSATLFPQCPPTGADTNGCELLITVTAVNGAGAATSFTVLTSSPDQGPYDSVEDTLIGITNGASAFLKSISLSGTAGGIGIFAFDGDGACVGTFSPSPTAAQCGGSFTSSDPGDYQSAGATFTGINGAQTSGTVLVGGGTGLSTGASTWFSLEGQISASVISGVPEPGSMGLIGAGLALVGSLRQRSRRK